MEDLVSKKCVACEGGVAPMTKEESHQYMSQVLGWELSAENTTLIKEYKFKDFKEAMAFVNKVADLAQNEGHHPDIHIFYNRVRLQLSTHAIKGLSENDFILAAKINAIKDSY